MRKRLIKDDDGCGCDILSYSIISTMNDKIENMR